MNANPGNFIKVGKGDAAYSCYIPKNLPLKENELKYDAALIYQLAEANRYLGRLDEITDTLVSHDYFVYMYARKEAALSSQIEGTQATFSDLIKSEAGIGEVPQDVDEIKNYIKAINYGFERLDTLPLSLRLIREIHAILMEGVRGERKTPGLFRTTQNWIGGYSIATAAYVPPAPEYLNAALDNFERFMHEKDNIPVLVKAALLHSQFEVIHPFLDGNGRAGRLLISFYLAANDILRKPTLYLSKYFKQYRKEYYECLFNIHAKGDYNTWIKFFLNGVVETAKEGVEIARKIVFIRKNDIKAIAKFGRTAENAMTLYNGLFEKPTVTIEEAASKLEISQVSASRLLEKFMAEEILTILDAKARKRIFVYKKYTDLFSGD